MKTSLLNLASQEVPRYTSYPTAVQFHQGVTEKTYTGWLQNLPQNQPLSLYVHIPFCHQMCWYCGCHTNIVSGYDRVQTYVGDLLHEIELVAQKIPDRSNPVVQLHFGGGSPSMLNSEDFISIIEGLKSGFSFDKAIEIAVEIDPRTVDEKKIAAYAGAGVNRVSLGVQDFNLAVQEKINRIQPPEMVQEVVKWLRSAGIYAINFDLIYGLPGQSLDHIRYTIERSLAMEPERFAVFGYAHVPWFKKHQQLIRQEDLPKTNTRMQQAELVKELLVAAGYIRIGFDHFARPDDNLARAAQTKSLRRNFQGYTDDDCDTLIGFGASAISALEQGYVQNDPHMGKWRKSVREGCLPTVRGLGLSDEDKFRRAAIMQILSQGQLDMAALCTKFGRDVDALDDAIPKLQDLPGDDLFHLSGRKILILEQGIRFSRNIAACFDPHWQPVAERHSASV